VRGVLENTLPAGRRGLEKVIGKEKEKEGARERERKE